MKLFSLSLFNDFHCLGSRCQDNCCRMGWDIELDASTAEFYQGLRPGSVYEEDGCWYLRQEGGCPFLSPEGLCSVQLSHGAGAISEICREHPRFYEWFGGYKEAGVGLCCEAVARAVCGRAEPLDFSEGEIDEEPDDLDYDGELLSALMELRRGLFALLQDRSIPAVVRVRAAAQAVRGLDESVFFCKYEDLARLGGLMASPAERRTLLTGLSQGDYRGLKRELAGLSCMGALLPELIMNDLDVAQELTCDELERDLEHLGVYYVFRYLLKAARDGLVEEKLRAMEFLVETYRMLILSERQRSGTWPDAEARSLVMKEISKELEYSPENMEEIYSLGGGEG